MSAASEPTHQSKQTKNTNLDLSTIERDEYIPELYLEEANELN